MAGSILFGNSMNINLNTSLQTWLNQQFGHQQFSWQPLTGDASPRQYHRIQLKNNSFILLQNPEGQSLHPFVSMSHLLYATGLTVPQVYTLDHSLGVALVTDLGDKHYLQALDKTTASVLYRKAMQSLCWMQTEITPKKTSISLPYFSLDGMRVQLDLFKTWYLSRHLNWTLSDSENTTLNSILETLILKIQEQPYAFTHMDYHSRNLMILEHPQKSPGILDFQDALWGPFTLDLVSLLKDCYIDWPRSQVVAWVNEFYDLQPVTKKAGYAPTQLLQWFDWTGLQRHLRILGTFSRLHHQEGKSKYLQDIPRILHYIREVCDLYPELAPILYFLRLETPSGVPVCAP